MVSGQSNFSMGIVLNRLRAIEEQTQVNEVDPGMEHEGKEINTGNFTRTMSRLNAIKDAVTPDHFQAVQAGVRAMYMNRRPNLQQMSALMDLLETVLGYVADDNSLFQRLKADLNKDAPKDNEFDATPDATHNTEEPHKEIGSPSTVVEPEEPKIKPASMRDLK
jgi:hypothetical protein